MDFLLAIFLLAIVAAPLAGLLVLKKTDSNVIFSAVTIALTFSLSFIAICISLIGGDFHIAAFALQLVAPVMGFFGIISLIIGNIILFKKKNMITPEAKKIVGIVVLCWIAFILVVAIAKYAIKKYDERPLGEYPDVEFSGRRFDQKAADTTVVYGRWDGKTHKASFVRESAIEEKGVYLELKDPETGETIVPERTSFNSDQTILCYSYKRNLYKYDFKKKTFSHITELSQIKKGCSHYFRRMTVSVDGNYLFYITGRTDSEMDELKNLYCCDLRTKEVKLLYTDTRWIEDLVVTPDGRSVIFFTGSIKSYDIETGKVMTLCYDPLRIVDVDFNEYELHISDDGKYLMYCAGSLYKFDGFRTPCYCVYAYDLEEDRAALIIKTDICNIDKMDWVREKPPVIYYFESEK